MKEEQVDRLLQELAATRESFDAAIRQIRWNRINTVIQYVLIAVVCVMMAFGIIYYLDEKRAGCERGNELRIAIQSSLDRNAVNIGIALGIVTDAPDDTIQDYIDAYNEQEDPEILKLREC